MTRFVLSFAFLAITCLATVSVHAQANRTFISGTGTDSNPCTFNSPCRTAQRAHDQTNPGGEINVLDPVGYGSLIINRAISIQGHGSGELVGASGGTAVSINAGPSDVVNLSGVIVEGFGTGFRGVVLQSASHLTIADSVVRNFTGDGILLMQSTSSRVLLTCIRAHDNLITGVNVNSGAANNRIRIENSTIQDNGGDAIHVNNANGPSGPFMDVVNTDADTIFATNSLTNLTIDNSRFLLLNLEQNVVVIISRSSGRGISCQNSPGNIFTFGNNSLLDIPNTCTITNEAQK